MADNKFLPKLSQNLLEILNDNEYYDITIEVGNDPYVKIFRAHMVILNYRSSFLRRILSTNKRKNGEELVHIKLPDISPEIFQIILRYIYGGRISLEEYDSLDIIKVLFVARKLSLQELIPYLQSFLIQNKSTWIEQNFSLVYQMSFENDSFTELQKFCTKLMSKEPEKIFKSPDFTSISEKSLISLIQNDNLKMREVQVWEYVLKWGFAKNPELSLDNFTSFSRDDFNTLKNTLKQCIPFIKFIEFTSREFLDKVYPYKNIIPEELYEDLIKLFLDNDYKPGKKSVNNKIKPEGLEKVPKEVNIEAPENVLSCKKIRIDSKIITYQHAELISKWIDKLETTNEIKNSYEFKLILRGSRNGFTPEKFHEICDNRFQTVSIIKVYNSDEILGGYNPIGWKSGNNIYSSDYGTTKDSFIFSFKNKNNTKNYILSRVKDEKFAIRYRRNIGPSFGNGDLFLQGNRFYRYENSCCDKNSYEKMIRETNDTFYVEEYEVFQITKD